MRTSEKVTAGGKRGVGCSYVMACEREHDWGSLPSPQGLEGEQGTHSHLMQPQSSPYKGRSDRWEVGEGIL